MELADKEWAMENAPVFHVSDETELASVVWYVNGISDRLHGNRRRSALYVQRI